MTALPFIVSLMGWMPAPIEISAINSLDCRKGKTVDISIKDGLFDFNVGFIGTAILAVFLRRHGRFNPIPNWAGSPSSWSSLHPTIRGNVCFCSWGLVSLLNYLYRFSLYIWNCNHSHRWLLPRQC